MAWAMSVLDRYLVKMMCWFVQWLCRWILSPCSRVCRSVVIGGVVQKGHIFMVLVMVVGLMVSCGWYVFAASVRAVWGVYRCWVQLVAWWAIKRRIGHVYSMVRS